MRGSNVLVFQSPGFEQDIGSLTSARPASIGMRVYSTERLAEHFLAIFDPSVLDIDLSIYWRPEHSAKRAAWAHTARALMRDIFSVFPFDAAVAPADDTPYWAEIGQAVEELGAPFIVLMKEVTHPEAQLTTLAPKIRHNFPWRAGHTLVNSRHSAEYAIACGAEPLTVEVIGQPRFDLYSRSWELPELTSLAPALDPSRPTLLFLSYEADAYLTLDARLRVADARRAYLTMRDVSRLVDHPFGDRTWLRQRCETEVAILEFAAAQNWNVIVKPHRQTHPAEREIDRRFVEFAAKNAGATCVYLDAALDARPLICRADVIVGFQTTALFEALALNKKTIYAHWARTGASGAEDGEMIPYWQWGDAVAVVRNPAELHQALFTDATRAVASKVGSDIALEWLGPLDGGASTRAWRRVASLLEERRANRRPTEELLRRQLLAAQGRHMARERDRATARRALYAVLSRGIGYAARSPLARRIAERIQQRRDWAYLRQLECTPNGDGVAIEVVAGPFALPLWRELARLGIRKLTLAFPSRHFLSR